MEKILKEIQQQIIDNNIWDFEFKKYENDNLLIIGSMDLGYYHDIEIIFEDVSYIACTTFLKEISIRLATEEEKKELNYTEDNYVICIIIFEDEPTLTRKNFIIARNVKYNTDLVYHYRRDDLKEGERIADWVK